MKAVIPAAGMGTRFLPASKNSPKEMLPLLDKPAIQYVVEEAIASGIDDIIIVTGRGKRALEDHFDHNMELEALLEKKGKHAELAEMRRIADLADNIHYVRQREPLGLGHAILCAKKHVGDEPFAVLLGDDIVFSEVPCTKQLMDKFDEQQGSIIAVEHVPRSRISGYGVVSTDHTVQPGLEHIADLVEKPRPEDAPSDLGILGRYVLTPAIFSALERTQAGVGGEIQLTDALRILRQEEDMYAYAFEGRRYDLGDKLEWLKTNIEVALADERFAEPLREFLEELRD